MRAFPLSCLVCVALVGCSDGDAPRSSSNERAGAWTGTSGSTQDTAASDDEADTPDPSDDEPPPYWTDAELAARGWSVTERDDDPVVCASSTCVCREALPFEITLEENLRVFRDALENGQGDRQVGCGSGVIGRCGAFRFFLFVGDVYRHEVRWFDAEGDLVGLRNVTDYDAYCGHSLARFAGRIPRCDTVVVDEVICGEAQPVLPPIEDLSRLLQGLMPEGSGP